MSRVSLSLKRRSEWPSGVFLDGVFAVWVCAGKDGFGYRYLRFGLLPIEVLMAVCVGASENARSRIRLWKHPLGGGLLVARFGFRRHFRRPIRNFLSRDQGFSARNGLSAIACAQSDAGAAYVRNGAVRVGLVVRVVPRVRAAWWEVGTRGLRAVDFVSKWLLVRKKTTLVQIISVLYALFARAVLLFTIEEKGKSVRSEGYLVDGFPVSMFAILRAKR